MSTTALEKLTEYVKLNGPIKSARVSSAQAKGAAKKYAYWGAVRYQIRLTKAGHLSNVARERASSDRRSENLAHKDCWELAEKENRIILQNIGPVNEPLAAYICEKIGL